jgi:hypothetical protein
MIPLALLGEGILIALAILGLAFFFMTRMAKGGGHGEGVLSLPSKLLLTAGLLGMLGYPFFVGSNNRGSALIALFMILLVTFPLVIMWLPHVIETVLSPFFGSLTGGNEQVEARPLYFRAIGLRKRGEYAAAIEAAEAELARFPGDVEGLLLIADIRRTDLRDPLGALELLEATLIDPACPPATAALLLSRVADLQLNQLNNPDAARGALSHIVTEFSGTEAAVLAQQRLSHLPTGQQLLERAERPKIAVPKLGRKLGLETAAADPATATDPSSPALKRTGDLVAHLADFPDDWERREELATLYAELRHPELAAIELEQLIAHPDAQPRHVARWLNDLANLQLKTAAGVDAAKLTLERIVSLFPETPAAEQAAARIRLLGLDRRGREAPRTLRLGTYDQNIGLKRGDAGIPDPAKTASSD